VAKFDAWEFRSMNKKMMFGSLTAVLLSCSLASAQWGDLKAKFVLKGTAPKPAALAVAKEPFGLKHTADLVDESLLVGKDNGIKNVVVWLVSKDKVKVHESYAAAAKEQVTLDNSKCRFEPRITLLQVGQKFVVKNSDPVGHNSNISLFNGAPKNPLIPSMGEVAIPIDAVEALPMPVSCNIHPWMSASLLIRDNPYMAVSDADGNLTIKNIPAGKWTFQVWHERPANITAPTVGGKAQKWAKGRVEVEIVSGKEIELGGGTVELTLDQLKPKS
jgi:hypothetical protein